MKEFTFERFNRAADAASAVAADVQVNETYTTAENTNNPIGLFATVAVWNGDALTVHDTTQNPHGARDALAATFGIDPAGVRVLVPFVGGGFGAGLRVWPHVPLAALAARMTKRPVKLVLTRAQMFTSVGHRPNTIQQLSIGASRDGQLAAIEHVSRSSIGMEGELMNQGHRGTVHHRNGGSDRERGLSRDGYAGPLVADLNREGAWTRVLRRAEQLAGRRDLRNSREREPRGHLIRRCNLSQEHSCPRADANR